MKPREVFFFFFNLAEEMRKELDFLEEDLC